MKKTTKQEKPTAEAQLVSFPVFASSDPVGRVAALAVAGRRDMQVSVRGERVIEREVEIVHKTSHEEIARDTPLLQLVEILKVKMYNESITDQTVYDMLFEDRLERQWARTYRAAAKPFWKKALK